MGKNPSIIFRELTKQAKHRQKAIGSVDGSTKSNLYKANEQDHCFYVLYKDVVKNFLIEGYSEYRAEKHINQWIDYDIIGVRYIDGIKYIGFSDQAVI